LDRCCNKPVYLTPLALSANSLYESSNPSCSAIVSLPFSYSFPKDYVPTWLLCLPGAFLSATIAALRQLAFVHEEFLERGQEVSCDLFLTSHETFLEVGRAFWIYPACPTSF
jgi:hypothetical protein